MPPQKKGKTGLKKGKSGGKTLDTKRRLHQAELENLRKHLGLNEKQVVAVIEEMTKTKVLEKDSNNNNTDDGLKRKQEFGNDHNDTELDNTPPKRFRKAKDEIDTEYNLLTQPRLTLEVNNQAQTFKQVNVSNSQNRSLWHAIQLLWLGREREIGRTLVLKYPVHTRVQQLWDSVMHGPSNTPVYQARHTLYSAMLGENEELEARIDDRRFGDLDTVQLIADALDLEIFIYIPEVTLNNTIKKTLIFARGTPQTDPSRQLHIAHWVNHRHWTALTPVESGLVPLVADEERWPHPRSGVLVPLPRLPVGHVENVELRSGGVGEEAVDGRVPDIREIAEDDEKDGQKVLMHDNGNTNPSSFPQAAKKHIHHHPRQHNHPKHVHRKHSHPEHNHPKHTHPKHNHPKHNQPQHDQSQHNYPPQVHHHPPKVYHHSPKVHHHPPQIHHHPPQVHHHAPQIHHHPPTHKPSQNTPKVHYHPPTYPSNSNHPKSYNQEHNNRKYNNSQHNYQESQEHGASDHVHFHFQKSGSDKRWERIRGPE